jgi:hypothetical protein
VVNSDGKLGGYGGGLWRKHWLLALETRVRLRTERYGETSTKLEERSGGPAERV